MSVNEEDLALVRLLLGEDFLSESLLGDKLDVSLSFDWDTTLSTSAVHLFMGGGGLFA